MVMAEAVTMREVVDSKLRRELETSEIEALGCCPSAEVYSKLLAVYLHEHDLVAAKFLWKRIPETIKNGCQELSKIWDVGKALWQRDLPTVYHKLRSTDWSDHVSGIMEAVTERVRERSLNLVSRAYTSISVSDFSKLVGLSELEAIELALRQPGWNVDKANAMVCPERRRTKEEKTIPAIEEQLNKLTDFVTFLEK